MIHLGDCINDCPRYFMANFYGTECFALSTMDISLIYFPFLIVMVLLFGLSYVGSRQKKKHLLVPNFIVLMGIVEHVALVTTIVLTFSYATFRYAASAIFIWMTYVAANIIFYHKHYKMIATKDKRYMIWRNRPDHIWVRRLMNALAAVFSWKAYKLSYSALFAFKLRPATFTDPKVFRDMQR